VAEQDDGHVAVPPPYLLEGPARIGHRGRLGTVPAAVAMRSRQVATPSLALARWIARANGISRTTLGFRGRPGSVLTAFPPCSTRTTGGCHCGPAGSRRRVRARIAKVADRRRRHAAGRSYPDLRGAAPCGWVRRRRPTRVGPAATGRLGRVTRSGVVGARCGTTRVCPTTPQVRGR
jgi:hypothetical protein